ncbi:MAG: CPBP family intramembrane glutamic endopeptidase [Planctomycetota bacterium]|nr:CPBP family intramembrane glutamic endopeptidase [Planctomycetota bacterium]
MQDGDGFLADTKSGVEDVTPCRATGSCAGERPSGSRIVLLAVALYGVFAAAGIGWRVLRGASPVGGIGDPPRVPAAIAAGIGFAAVAVLSGELMLRRFDWARRMEREFAQVVRGLTQCQIVVLSVLSAVGEEIFFRGAMQPVLGLWLTTCVFALVHIPWTGSVALWPVFAFIAGLGLGWLFDIGGGLLAPVLGHLGTNTGNLLLIRRRALLRQDGVCSPERQENGRGE